MADPAQDHNFVEAHWILGWIYDRQEKYREALDEFETAIDLSQENPLILGDRAGVYVRIGERGRARGDYVPTGFRPPTRPNRAVKRHEFGLRLPADERRVFNRVS